MRENHDQLADLEKEEFIVIKKVTHKLPYITNDLTNEEYHSKDCPGVSNSDLSKVGRSEKHYIASKNEHKKSTPEMELGSLVHCLILEPETMVSRYAVAPELDRRTKVGKEEYQCFVDTSAGKIVVSEDTMNLALNMRDAFNESKCARKLLEGCSKELSIFSRDHATGVVKKCRPDIINIEKRYLVDIKTTQNCAPNEWRREIVKWSLDKQAAYYVDICSEVTGNQFDTFIHICIEKSYPHGVAIYMLNDAVIEAGRELYKQQLLSYRDHSENIGEPRGYPDCVQVMDMANYGFDLQSR